MIYQIHLTTGSRICGGFVNQLQTRDTHLTPACYNLRMGNDFRPKWYISISLLVALCLLSSPVTAQSVTVVRASPPIVDQFPQITLFVAVVDETGRYISGLLPSNFSVIENNTRISEVSIQETQVGTRQIYVVNTTSGLKIRDPLGNSRFDLIREALLDWWQLREASLYGTDDLSLVTAEGVLVSHSRSTAELASTLDRLEPPFEDNVSGYDLLLQALDFTSDPTPMPGMPSHLIFATTLLRTPRDLPIANIIARARDTGTTIYPILIGPVEALEQPEAEPLRQLAEETDGQLILFDPSLGLNELAHKILLQRTQYRLTYSSRVASAGLHQAQIQYTDNGQDTLSDIRNFEIDVRPPDVTFVQPPDMIQRKADPSASTPDALFPSSQRLQCLITFSDQYPRAIVSSQLYVDGELMTQHNEEPFDIFDWDLSEYLETETHTLQVVVYDSLGIQGASISHPIDVLVETPPSGLAALKPALGSLVAALAVLVAGVVLAVGLISMGRGRLGSSSSARRSSIWGSDALHRAGLRSQKSSLPVEAYLIPFDTEGNEGDLIPLTGVDFIFGSDPSMTSAPLLDPSVAGIHARLTRQAAGDYLLRDQGSVAGTWINYELVSEEGNFVKHGDLIHIGRLSFRFRLPTPPSPPEIRVRPAIDTPPKPSNSQETSS
jgi:hypothetical protein